VIRAGLWDSANQIATLVGIAPQTFHEPGSEGRISRVKRAGNDWLARSLQVRRGEGRAVLAAAVLFFVLLTSLMILRPVREALGLSQGIEVVRRLFLLTLVATIALGPMFGWLAGKVPRRRLVALSLRICGFILLLFFLGVVLLPEERRGVVASVYYVFHSVFNLFVVALFWAFMADAFTLGESKRLFPAIALGGSLGAIVGSLISGQLARHVGVPVLFPLAAVLLELAVWSARWFTHVRGDSWRSEADRVPIGGAPWSGIRSVLESSYVRGIGVFVALTGVASTFLYFSGLRLVAAAADSTAAQTALFAHINLWTQVATLLAQAFVAERVMRWAGVGSALVLLPCLATAGGVALALAPNLAVFMLVNALFRATQQGITGPAQHTLFTVLEREQKYKAKAFLETFGYRAGDATGAGLEKLLAAAGAGWWPLGAAVVVIAFGWTLLCRFLERVQESLAQSRREH
jgi:ATP:ADP antiporter, AAA family